MKSDPLLSRPVSDHTKSLLLDTAERLFGELGVDATSLRAITSEAGANLAAVNYHFGSKEGLVQAVLSRRLQPLNRKRLARLETARAAAGANPPGVEEIVRAFVAPAVEMAGREPGGHLFARFVMRAFSEPSPRLQEMVSNQFARVVESFTEALAAALPELPPVEIHWRFHFLVGAMVHTVGLGFLAERFSDGICDPLDVEGVTERLVSFVVGGMSRPDIRGS